MASSSTLRLAAVALAMVASGHLASSSMMPRQPRVFATLFGDAAPKTSSVAFVESDELSALVVDVPGADVLRGSLDLSDLQTKVEALLARTADGTLEEGATKVFVACSDCEAESSEVEALVRSELVAMWANAVKPAQYEAAPLSDFVDVDVRVLPDSRNPTCAAAVDGLKSALASAGVSNRLDGVVASGGGSGGGAPAQADMESLFACHGAMEGAFQTFVDQLPALSAALAEIDVEEFGAACDDALDAAVQHFNGASAAFDGTASKAAKGKELVSKVHGELRPLYLAKLAELNELANSRLKKSFRKLSITDGSLLKDMEAGVKDADAFFSANAKKMVCRGAGWSANQERRAMVSKMRAFVKERLQVLHLGGKYVPGMRRKPVAVSLHWLVRHPLQLLDAIQDSLSFDDEMEYDPNMDYGELDGMIRTPQGVTDETNAYAARVSANAEVE
mmetsp:Transcript_29556/g.68628  ORF Transcript_29556/g.68628 Transcript_29556/m.68628 type:complete len:449 (+) Transcript_29556:39-1385(+)